MQSGTVYDPDRNHYFVVCTNPDASNQCLTVPICTYKNSICDDACIIEPMLGIDFIKHKSYMLYREARIISCDAPQNTIINKGMLENKQLFSRICNGIETSSWIRRKYKKYYQHNKDNQ
ncbi:MAG: hypothetical protein K0U45_04465 [Alphaproteobacteria bacterium]|nr:hypothetical protein [Alphaproteobacteria bacterium]